LNTKQIARETLEALERGYYAAPDGTTIDLAPLLKRCITGTDCYQPDDLDRIRSQVLVQPAQAQQTEFEVLNETTLQGCARLIAQGYRRVGALNFASARNPGGGFLNGAKAQEESLARSSGLYNSLLKHFAFYEFHRKLQTTLYSDRMIYSPDCPIIRTDDGGWLDKPLLVDFITSPAPNAGAVQQNEPENVPQIVPTLRERGSKLLALAAHRGCDALVLGAWGCGVFRNDPKEVAAIFHEHLNPKGKYWGYFRKVVFSVYDKSHDQGTFQAFSERFSNLKF